MKNLSKGVGEGLELMLFPDIKSCRKKSFYWDVLHILELFWKNFINSKIFIYTRPIYAQKKFQWFLHEHFLPFCKTNSAQKSGENVLLNISNIFLHNSEPIFWKYYFFSIRARNSGIVYFLQIQQIKNFDLMIRKNISKKLSDLLKF